MTERIFKSIVSVTTIILLIGFSLIVGILYHHFETETFDRLKIEASYLSVAVNEFGVDYLSQISNSQRITLIASNGTVLFDNQVNQESMTNHLSREEVQEALSVGFGKGERLSETLNTKTLYYALRTEDGNVLRISDHQSTVLSLMYGLIQPMLIIFFIALCLAWVIAKKISTQITQPINELDLEHPENNEAYQELQPLLSSIRRLRKRIDEQIHVANQKQEEFKMITNHMAEGFVVIGKDLSILSYNDSICRHLNINLDMTSQSVYVLSHEKGFVDFIEYTMQGHHGEWTQEVGDFFYQWLSNPVKNNGEIGGAVIVMMDVTEKTKRENYRREFTANISHELKTPLTSISGFAEIMQNGIVKEEDVQMFAGDIYKESQRLIQLVNDIIRISQLDDHSLIYQKEEVDAKLEIEHIVETLRHAASKRHISIYMNSENLIFQTVPSIFREVVYNLLDNAIKYNKENGEIDLQFYKNDARFILKVKDTGIGIPVADQQRIFERFYRVDKSRSSQNGGTGLGLSIVKHGVTTLGGTVDIHSVLHEGTEIIVKLPLK